MTKEGVTRYLGEDWKCMLEIIHSSLHSGIRLLDYTNESLLANAGKLLRPMLSLLTARAVGSVNTDSYRYAAASELFHNATLMHDDVADDSAQRRGRPTVSALLGPSAAVLVGDYWLSKAVELVVSAEDYREVVKLFAKTLTDLAEGEMLQMEKASSCDTTEEDYYKIIYCKTASLFVTAACSGALSAGAPADMVNAAREFATCLGIAFQIKDDILDYEGTGELGKPVGVDLKEQKITLPLLGALKGSAREVEIRGKVGSMLEHPEYCDEVRTFVLENGGLEYAYERLDEYVGRAVRALDVLPDSEAKTFLAEIARFNIDRKV